MDLYPSLLGVHAVARTMLCLACYFNDANIKHKTLFFVAILKCIETKVVAYYYIINTHNMYVCGPV